MHRIHRVGFAVVLCATGAGAVTPASAQGVQQVHGTGAFDMANEVCPDLPGDEFSSYPPILIEGDLQGCWYTTVDSVHDNGQPSGVYLETGREKFVGSAGTFETTYKFESRWMPSDGGLVEVKGRCQHPIVDGSGTGDFTGVTGRLEFKDIIVGATTTYEYRGHVRLG